MIPSDANILPNPKPPIPTSQVQFDEILKTEIEKMRQEFEKEQKDFETASEKACLAVLTSSMPDREKLKTIRHLRRNGFWDIVTKVASGFSIGSIIQSIINYAIMLQLLNVISTITLQG